MRRRAHHFASTRVRHRLMPDRVEVFQRDEVDLVTPGDRFEHEDERGVLIGQHALERVHHEREL